MRLAAATPTIHLLLTDFSMPGATGLELAEQFRTVHPQTPVLMISGSLAMIDGQTGHLDRFAVLAKPFTSDDLVHKVRTLLSGESQVRATTAPAPPAPRANVEHPLPNHESAPTRWLV